jgi:large subunit ribosomal protein L30
MWAKTTLDGLNLDRRFRATIVPESDEYLGMLRKVKEEVAWTKADAGIVKELLEKRGRKTGYKPITKSDLPKEYKTIEDFATAIAENKVAMSKLEGMKPWFALSPPKGGFKRKTKTQYAQNGILGEDGELVEIVKRML